VPTAKKCDIKADSPKVIVVNAPQKKQFFSCFNIYISFFSEAGMAVQVKPVFSTV
jgi:hypothetical protein